MEAQQITNQKIMNWFSTRGGGGVSRDGLIAEWLFSGNADDTSINENDGTTVNDPQLVDDRKGAANRAYHFNGIDQSITVPSKIYIEQSEPFSISVWVKIDTLINQYPAFLSIQTDQGGFLPFSMLVSKQSTYNGICFGAGLAGTGFRNARHDVDVDTLIDEWIHIVLIYNPLGDISADDYDLYLNNVSVPIVTAGTFATTANVNQIGNSGAANYFKGSIDNVRIYNKILTESEINQLYNE